MKDSISSAVLSFLTVFCLCLSIIVVVVSPTSAQDPCPEVEIGGDLHLSYPAGSHVRVYWGRSVNPTQRAIITQALNNWSNNNGRGVVFFTEEGSGPLYRYMDISMEAPADTNARAKVQSQVYDTPSGVLRGTHIIFDPAVTDPTALLNTSSHEIGHTFGIGHPTVDRLTTRTAMSLYNTANGKNDTTTGASGPTDCDKKSIDAVYNNGGVRHSTGTGGDGGGGDGGGDGGDGCPCGDCIYGCDPGGGGDDGCQLIAVEGQCYAGVDYYDEYGRLINSEPGYCDPPTEQYFCP